MINENVKKNIIKRLESDLKHATIKITDCKEYVEQYQKELEENIDWSKHLEESIVIISELEVEV